jgi:hypothetical protein
MGQEPVSEGGKVSVEYAAYYWGRTEERGFEAEESMRKFLVENGWFGGVVSMPGNP